MMTCRTSCAKRIPRRAASRKHAGALIRGHSTYFTSDLGNKYCGLHPIGETRKSGTDPDDHVFGRGYSRPKTRQFLFVKLRRLVIERRVETLAIVDLLDEGADPGLGFGQVAIG
jgi:hypothetical protein